MKYKKKVAYYYDERIGSFDYGNGHPMKPLRVKMTHDLIKAYAIDDYMDKFCPLMPSGESMTRYHADDFVEFLRNSCISDPTVFREYHTRFNIGDDCPVFDGLWDFCRIYSGGSIGGAISIVEDGFQNAVNWAGGLHHGKKQEASGFCYLNDCVLAALEFLKSMQRILYVDIDVHHGDGMEEAFYTTPRALCCSFHKHGDFFPGTGAVDDIGSDEGRGYSINVPLRNGVDDKTFVEIFHRVMTQVMTYYNPEVVILQSGADSLAGDRLGCFNLSVDGHAYAVSYFKSVGIPILQLGGGGYTLRNVPRCWAYETSLLCDVLPQDLSIPTTSEYYGYYGPDYQLAVRTSSMENKNDEEYLMDILMKVDQTFNDYVYPVGGPISALDESYAKSSLQSLRDADADGNDDKNVDISFDSEKKENLFASEKVSCPTRG